MSDLQPPSELTATIEDYRNAHPDYRTETDGVKRVLMNSTKGTVLVEVKDE